MYIPRLRKKENVIKEIRIIDPHTALTYHVIHKLTLSKEITEIHYGNAHLINLDELYDYFYKKGKKK